MIALRAFIREALDLGPVPDGVAIPLQGPARVQGGSGARGKGEGDKGGKGGGGGAGGGEGGGGAGGDSGGIGLGIGHELQGGHEPH